MRSRGRPRPARRGAPRRGRGSIQGQRSQAAEGGVQAPPERGVVRLPEPLTVRQLAELLKVSAIDVIKGLMKHGIMAAINQVIGYEVAKAVAGDFGWQSERAQAERPAAKTAAALAEETEAPSALLLRPPVVTILGHVDHGKTTLLDYVRNTRVAAQEAGGITQHIGAYQAEVKGQKITFIDTPGHEAFTAMRARGAQVTDIAVLVVAADDGIMPQTVEAIDHARAANVPIVVAINKIDLPSANPDQVKRQLSERSLVIEEWGGDVICVSVSARTGDGVDELLANILVLAEVLELRANPDRRAMGTVIEAALDTSRGPMATVLVSNGTLRIGDVAVVGNTWGRIKAMFDHLGRRVRQAEPSTPVKVMGLVSLPAAGDILTVVKDEATARALVDARQRQVARPEVRGPTLESLSSDITAGKTKELNIVLKADVQGSVEAIRTSLERLGDREVKLRIIHAGAGNITESDVMLALATSGIVIGFNTRPEPGGLRLADAEKVEIRQYNIIYQLLDDLEKALKGLLEPVVEEVVDGHAETRQVFRVGGRNSIAGCYVRDGQATRNSLARVWRGGTVVHTSRVASLKRFKEDAREVAAGYECGIAIEGFDSFQVGDLLEFYRQQRRAR